MRVYYYFIILFLISTPVQIFSYSECEGIKEGDVIIMSYEGKFSNGTLFDKGDEVTFVVAREKLTDGFYYNILGMKIGDQKSFTVPPEEGYLSPDHPFYGLTLNFLVLINDSVSDVESCDSGDTGSRSTIIKIINTFMIVLVSFLSLQFLRSLLYKSKIKNCSHCKANGVKKAASGICDSCGTPHCTASFSNGCTVCKANSFSRYKSY